MRRMVAWTIYVLGGMLALRSIISGFAHDDFIAGFYGLGFGIATWWFAVGFGVRLGVSPDDFVASVKYGLGFGPPPEQEEPAPKEAL